MRNRTRHGNRVKNTSIIEWNKTTFLQPSIGYTATAGAICDLISSSKCGIYVVMIPFIRLHVLIDQLRVFRTFKEEKSVTWVQFFCYASLISIPKRWSSVLTNFVSSFKIDPKKRRYLGTTLNWWKHAMVYSFSKVAWKLKAAENL